MEMSWASSPRLFRKRIFRVNLELKREDFNQVSFILRRGLLEILIKCNITSREWLKRERVTVEQELLNLDCKSGERGRGPLSPKQVPDEGPKQCQECLHVPCSMDNHQSAQVFPEPEEEHETILLSFHLHT